jgi:Na+/H+ antiporter
MLVFEWTLILLTGAVVLSAIARRLGVPYPAFLALGGASIALIPSVPHFTLDPQLTLALFLAPVLLDAAYDTSLRDLKENWLPVGSLVVVAVLVTTIAVALVAHLFVPTIPWAAAIALGAIVAPPDAAAATAIFRQVRLPYRLSVILEGESLLNDASALLIYKMAVAAVVVGNFHASHVLPAFAFVLSGSVIVGWIFAQLIRQIMKRITDAPTSIVLQFVSTFSVWILAEHFGLSGILTVVIYGIVIARTAPIEVPARLRVPSYAVWDTVVFILNVMAFLLIGLQLGPIWSRLSSQQRFEYIGVAVAVLVTTILARFAWVMTFNYAFRWKIRRFGENQRRPMLKPTIRGGLIISWCGMRGIVTLAAALALPDGRAGPVFPYRDLIVLCAFSVVIGTLVIQGFTLRPLLSLLNLRDNDPVEQELNFAKTKALQAAFAAIENDTSAEAIAIRREYEDLLHQAAGAPDGHIPDHLAGDTLRRKAVVASRKAIADLRANGQIGDAAFHQLEERLDLLELSAGGRDGDS